jgi:hypothetical protein
MSPDTLSLLAGALALLGVVLMLAGVVALLRVQLLGALAKLLTGALLFAVGLLFGTFALGVYGFRALTHEVVAARIDIQPMGAQRFSARFHFSGGGSVRYELAGDEIYIDAQIIKWTPWANLLGLHTGYSLDRVAGRYRDVTQERTAPRTVFSLAPERLVDLYALRKKFTQLAPLFDAEYGSASFVPADSARTVELRVSTTGLLIRDAAK